MNKELSTLLTYIAKRYESLIAADGIHYVDVDLSDLAESMGLTKLKNNLKHTGAIIPLKHHLDGMKVMIDGRTFVKYVQFDSGVAVPEFVAKASGLPSKPYVANDSMILNC